MYARSTTVHGSPEKMDDGIRFIRDQVMPMVEGLDGSVGLSMLADRDSGRCIVTTAWESQDAMRASADAVKDSRARAGEVLGDERPEVAEWEIALVHRVRPADAGACTRVVWAQRDPGPLDELRDVLRTQVVPQVEELPGFCSISMLVDPASGRCAVATTYDSRASMMQAGERAASLRSGFAQAAGMQITEMAEFDLVIAHLRVPELV